MLERIWQMVMKEFAQALRDRRMRFLIVVAPLIQLVIFGYVVTTDVVNVRTALYDQDRSQSSREFARRLESSGYFSIVHTVESPDALGELLDRGEVSCAVQINPGFEKKLYSGSAAPVQVIADGTDSNTAMISMNYVSMIAAGFGRDIAEQSGVAGSADPRASRMDARIRNWYNPELRSRNFNVPGVIASIVMIIGLMLTAMSVVREREMGTIEQLMVTPIRPFELILGKTIPFAAIGFFDMMLVTVVGAFWFNVPIKGSLPLLFLCTGIYLLSVLGTGLYISTISRTQQQSMMAAMLFYIPALLLSGFVFPIANMPAIFQYLTYINPLRYFLVIIRGIFLKGNGIEVVWPQMAALLVLGVAILALSTARFSKRLK
ncbi:MAG: ABC transporter permease [Syntrophobacteraceae bacterium]